MVRVIGVTDGSLISDDLRIEVEVKSGEIGQDTSQDLLKAAMVDRFGRFEGAGLGLIRGFGLKRGAVGTSYNGLCQNLLVVGADDHDMLLALERMAALGGGFVVVAGGKVLAELPLPLYGLLTDLSLEEATARMESVYRAMRGLGCGLSKGPLHTLAFTGVCGEIGHLKIGHAGLFDVAARRFAPIVID
jgi:adenine deaminase